MTMKSRVREIESSIKKETGLLLIIAGKMGWFGTMAEADRHRSCFDGPPDGKKLVDPADVPAEDARGDVNNQMQKNDFIFAGNRRNIENWGDLANIFTDASGVRVPVRCLQNAPRLSPESGG